MEWNIYKDWLDPVLYRQMVSMIYQLSSNADKEAFLKQERENSLFFVPYMIFSLCCAVYLVLPSRYNKGRANWESIVVLLRADRAVYRPYAEQEVDDA